MKAKKIEIRELSNDRIAQILSHAKPALPEDEYVDVESALTSLAYITQLLENEKTTAGQLRRLLFGAKSERLEKVLEKLDLVAGQAAPAVAATTTPASDRKLDAADAESDKKLKGHGRNGAAAYPGAETVFIPHETLKPGDPCPERGCRGKVYEMAAPKVLVRVVGRAPAGASVTRLQRLRCNLCLRIFTAKRPAGMGPEKYDATAGSIIALLRYGTGVPFNRLEGLQQKFGIPLPASTQWDIVLGTSKKLAPAFAELMRQSAQDDVFHNDDTPMKIQALMQKRRKTGDG